MEESGKIMSSKIIATGSCVPPLCLSNHDLAGWLDTSDEWIRTRTGISTRHLAAKPERMTDGSVQTRYEGMPLLALAAEASERAIAQAEEKGFDRADIDLILAATSSPDELFPVLACRLQEALHLPHAAAYDMVLACTGFLAALQAADAYIRSGIYRNILVVGGEVLSRFINWNDRDTAILFGDGAGAVIVSADARFGVKAEDAGSTANGGADVHARGGILCSTLHADGSGGDSLFGKAMYWNGRTPAALQMDGKAVFTFAVRRVPEVILETLDKAAKSGTPFEPELYVLHQANYRIIEAIARKLKQPIELFPHNLDRYGNTSAASIPILLDELNRAGKLKEGMPLCLAGFGAGLSYGAALLRW